MGDVLPMRPKEHQLTSRARKHVARMVPTAPRTNPQLRGAAVRTRGGGAAAEGERRRRCRRGPAPRATARGRPSSSRSTRLRHRPAALRAHWREARRRRFGAARARLCRRAAAARGRSSRRRGISRRRRGPGRRRPSTAAACRSYLRGGRRGLGAVGHAAAGGGGAARARPAAAGSGSAPYSFCFVPCQIWNMAVERTARTPKARPSGLRSTSETVAMPTPARRMRRESLTLCVVETVYM